MMSDVLALTSELKMQMFENFPLLRIHYFMDTNLKLNEVAGR